MALSKIGPGDFSKHDTSTTTSILFWMLLLHPKMYVNKFQVKQHYAIPCGIFPSDFNLLYSTQTVGTGASKNIGKGIDTQKFIKSIGRDTLSTDTCCREMETLSLFGSFCFGLKCLQLVSLSFLCPLLSFIYTHKHSNWIAENMFQKGIR